jgi:hypothetical protein
MFRINRTDGHSRTVVNVDGYLSGECIEVVEGCCDQALSSMGRVDLYLRDVSVIDQAGRALLARLAARGVRLLASGVYNSHLVQELSTACAGRRKPSSGAGTQRGGSMQQKS